jgi:hypothetical protein
MMGRLVPPAGQPRAQRAAQVMDAQVTHLVVLQVQSLVTAGVGASITHTTSCLSVGKIHFK